ncbi:hypothetical protein FE391_44050 [Nonomuraea sp. KC401]|uniref:hypothetical protein n=1 Tax=unclassified Nonomuraea TaxID=2593643 RepID=UPI0010FEFB08|nr:MULTISPECIES: hypothetical protein [unclassified Nonomuraea]NBF00294.1 hypothetical protein [Nonomuraea sp. K271]TLF51855.1 hypothetical protein FE391_44050 [Nonomuraea sp. KC401]
MKHLRIIAASSLTALGVGLAVFTIFAPAPSSTATAHDHPTRPVADTPLPGASLDRILAAIKCDRPSVQVDASELRQVSCRTGAGRYVVMTFTTRKNQDAWYEGARAYGGTYLVGDRWTVVSDPKLLAEPHAQLGGRIETHHH